MSKILSLSYFTEIVKLAKGESETQLTRFVQAEQDTYEMHVRAANMVRAGESLMKLVSDIKQYLILNDFPSVNEAIANNSKIFRSKQQECDQKLMHLRDDMAADLYDLEEEYYNSIYKVWSYVSMCAPHVLFNFNNLMNYSLMYLHKAHLCSS